MNTASITYARPKVKIIRVTTELVASSTVQQSIEFNRVNSEVDCRPSGREPVSDTRPDRSPTHDDHVRSPCDMEVGKTVIATVSPGNMFELGYSGSCRSALA